VSELQRSNSNILYVNTVKVIMLKCQKVKITGKMKQENGSRMKIRRHVKELKYVIGCFGVGISVIYCM
jgi:hypothetical protein